MMDRVTPEVEHAVVTMSRHGAPVNTIAEHCHITRKSVVRIRRDYGVGRKSRLPLTDEERATALALLEEGASYKEVARTLGRDHANITRQFPGYAWPHQQCGQFGRLTKRFRSIEMTATATRYEAPSIVAARTALRTVASHDGHPDTEGRRRARFMLHFRTLVTRVEYYDLTIAEIGVKIGVTEGAYASRLRRAMHYAATLEARAAKPVIGK